MFSIPLTSICLVLFFHFLGDFIMQDDWMAQNKSKDILALLTHVATYATWVFIPLVFVYIIQLKASNSQAAITPLVLIYPALNIFLHFCTDFVTSRISSYYWSKGDMHNFFVTVGADQLIHYATFALTLYGLVYFL